MKKHELLVPVGNYESLIAAINNGADAVYLGGKKFGARAFANNFTLEEIEKVIKLCHLYDVKVYITVNTLVHDEEIDSALEYVKTIHRLGVDAVIMQDVGLIDLVHHTLPNLEIHASTQMHNHSKESLDFLKKLGIKRVVFAREMSLEEINDIDTELEKEVFIHGSLCICYSGQCLFSSCILNRSGNRGECAGMCRLPYKLFEEDRVINTDGDYLLSPKDLCSAYDFQKLLESDIVSFKIEGRMKSPAYVAIVTKIYRQLIDRYEKGEPLLVNENEIKLLKSIFNREYTKGYLLNDHDIMNHLAPNHMGIHLGKVIEITPKKIKIKLDYDLKQFEGIRFKESDKGITINFMYDQHDNLINNAKKGDVIFLDNFIELKSLDEVVLTSPLVNLSDNVVKKVGVNFKCLAKLEKNLTLVVTDGKNNIEVTGDIVQKSINSPITKERIEICLNKTGNTPFIVSQVEIAADENIFISVGSLNKLRREALEKLKEVRENQKKEYFENNYNPKGCKVESGYGPVINVLVRTQDQIKACEDLGIQNIIVEDPKLMKSHYIYKIPRDNQKHDYQYDELLVTDYASLDKYSLHIADYHLNVFNHYTFNYLQQYARSVMLSPELNLSNIEKLMQNFKDQSVNAEVLVYGRGELMIMKHCLLKSLVNQDDVCHVCQNNKKYFLFDRNQAKYPIINNPLTHSTVILHHNVTNLISEIDHLRSLAINSFRVEFYDETYEDSKMIISQIISKILM